MKFITHGKGVSRVEVTHISKHGIWLATRAHEIFISFKEFPWFQDATVRKLMHVEQSTPTCLHWPDLEIDLSVESVRCFPLMSTPSRPTPRSTQQTKTVPLTQSKSSRRSASIRTSPKEPNTSFSRVPHVPNTSSHAQGEERSTAQRTD